MEEIPSEVCDELEDLGLPCNCPVPVTSVKGTYDVPAIDGIPDSIKGLLNVSIWWRHDTEAFPALLALCEENPLVTGCKI